MHFDWREKNSKNRGLNVTKLRLESNPFRTLVGCSAVSVCCDPALEYALIGVYVLLA